MYQNVAATVSPSVCRSAGLSVCRSVPTSCHIFAAQLVAVKIARVHLDIGLSRGRHRLPNLS